MKQSLILWISAAMLTFLIGFLQSRTSDSYPISGTIGIEGQKVSYHFNKIQSSKDDFKIMIRTDLTDLAGIVTWRKVNHPSSWEIDTLNFKNGVLTTSIPRQEPLTKLEYKVILYHNSNEYMIPTTEKEEILFLGAVPAPISIHYYLTLFVGLLLSIRAGFETFNEKPRLRLYSIFTLISFISCALIFAPVKTAYELGAINKSVPPITELFAGWLILLVIIWIINLIQVSFTKSAKTWVIVFFILSILIFIGQNF